MLVLPRENAAFRSVDLTRAAVAAFALTMPAAAVATELLDSVRIGRWNGGALVRDGAVSQCILGTRFKAGEAAADAFAYTVFHSISRFSGLSIAFQDKNWHFESGNSVQVQITFDGEPVGDFEAKAVGSDVVAIFPAVTPNFRAGLAHAARVTVAIADDLYDFPVESVAEATDWLDDCAGRHGLSGPPLEAQGGEDDRRRFGP